MVSENVGIGRGWYPKTLVSGAVVWYQRARKVLVLGDSQVTEFGDRVGVRQETDGQRRGLAVNWQSMEQAELVVGHSRVTKTGLKHWCWATVK